MIATKTKTGRKLRLAWLFGLMLLLGIVWFVLQLVLPGPKIIVSRQTTYLTQPLADDGLPDFEAYLYKQESEGATFENNAAVSSNLAQRHRAAVPTSSVRCGWHPENPDNRRDVGACLRRCYSKAHGQLVGRSIS